MAALAGGPPYADMLPRDFTLLQVTPALDGGGVETLTVDAAAAVARAGARSLVASRGGRLETALASAGGELIRMPVDSRNPLTLIANARRLRRVIRDERVSLVHVRSRAPAFSAVWAARVTGIPVVATYHGIYAARSPLKRWYNGVMTRGDAVIANSIFTRDHVLAQHRIAPSKIVVIAEGIDSTRFDPAMVGRKRVEAVRAAWGIAPDESRRVVLVVARLTGWKGHSVLIEALARSTVREETVLICVGRGETTPMAASLRALALGAGLSEQVRLVGPFHDMPAAYLAADMIAAPSTEPESFGRGVAEAGAMTKVVLASRLGGPAETIVDGATGWLVAPGDPEAWARALETAFACARPELEAMGAAARARVVEHYSLETMTAATFDLYGRLCEKSA